MVNVVCLYWGNKYKTEYVNILYNMTQRHLTIPHNFIIYTEHTKMPKLVKGDNVIVRKLPFHDYEHWWNKLTLFSPEANLEGDCLYFDLDVVILENIDCFFTHAKDKKVVLMRDFNPTTQGFNSSVMRFNNEVMIPDVWSPYLKEKKRLGAQAFLEASAKQKTRMGSLIRSTIFPGLGQFYSGRKLMGYTFMGSELAAGALAYMSFTQYQTAQDDYIKYQTQYAASTDPDQIAELKGLAQKALDDESAANDQITLMLYAVGAIHVTNMVHAFIRGPKVSTASKKTGLDLVYNQNLKQPQLRFSIALD